MPKNICRATSTDYVNEPTVIDLTKKQTNIFINWHTSQQAVGFLYQALNSGIITLEVSKTLYAELEKRNKSMVDSGIFTSKYDFRTGWILTDIKTGQILS